MGKQVKNNLNLKDAYKIMILLEKNNGIDILFYRCKETVENYNNLSNINSIEKINQNFDYIIDEDGQKILDVYKDMLSKIMLIIQLSKEEDKSMYIIISLNRKNI